MQDQWRIIPKLTLDYGVRFTEAVANSLQLDGNFVPGLYASQTTGSSAVASPRLYQYGCSGGKQVAIDPTTGRSQAGVVCQPLGAKYLHSGGSVRVTQP